MIVNGKEIADSLLREVSNGITHLSHKPHLTVCSCAPDFATKKYLAIKQVKAREVGIGLSVVEFPHDSTTETIISSIPRLCMQTDAIVIQLPFPSSLDVEAILDSVPVHYDADAMRYASTGFTPVMAPVAGAVKEIARHYQIDFKGKDVVVVGKGRLVGRPCERLARDLGGNVKVFDQKVDDLRQSVSDADILILGTGVAGLIRPDMIKSGVVIFDAGTSEDGGVLVGDADPSCSNVASFITPVPGGIGPITIAVLLRNVLTLATKKS